jgi:hypothetical protein
MICFKLAFFLAFVHKLVARKLSSPMAAFLVFSAVLFLK